MKRRDVVLAPEAKRDLLSLYDQVADATSAQTAARYLERIEAYLNGIEYASERGTLRDDIRPGLRTIGFERRLTIAFTVSDAAVTILCVFYGGRDWAKVLEED